MQMPKTTIFELKLFKDFQYWKCISTYFLKNIKYKPGKFVIQAKLKVHTYRGYYSNTYK